MASIKPFRALRPAPDAAPAVASVPYDVVSTEEARALAQGNPLSFLHVTRSEIDLPEDVDPYSDRVYHQARQNLERLRAEAPLVVHDTPALYAYRLSIGAHEQLGIAGCFLLDEYEQDLIRKHERTRRDKEDDRTRHIVALRAQTGVVFLTYRAVPAIDALARRVAEGEPLYDFTAPDGVRHTVWATGLDGTRQLVTAFAEVPALYIADGHHRAASAARARTELQHRLGGPADEADANTFLAVAFPHDQVQILPYNRIVRDLGGRSGEDLLAALRGRFHVIEGTSMPARKGQVGLYVAGRWYTIDLSGAAPEDDSRASSLDVALLQQHVLQPLLGIGDIRTDKRIDFVGGARGAAALEAAVDSGRAAVAFSMFPVSAEDLFAVSDAGGIMPPKSTWFEPKLRDGLLIHTI
jgi:uncharacterized protein (DUF1015 family)